MNPVLRLLLPAALLLVTACGNVPVAPPMLRASPQAVACGEWFAALDRQIDDAGVRDAGSQRVPGHPYLRVDRFSASFRTVAQEGGPAFERWVERLRELDLRTRDGELRQLPEAAVAALAGTVRDVLAKADTCGRTLAQEDLASAEGRARLGRLAVVPDDYAQWVHSSGVFALARIPFAMGVRGWYREAQEMFDETAAGRSHAKDIRRVDPAGPAVSREQVHAVFARTPRDALGVPRFSPDDEAMLFRAYAPRYEIETTGRHDGFGALRWQPGEAAPQVDSTRPMVYRRLAFTRMQGRVLTQLAYTIWFPERPRAHALDLLGGALDGLVMRVTLDDRGAPLVWDTIHPCGCYHMFFPTPALQVLAAPAGREEWALIPSRLPAMAAADRVAVRTATGSHYLVAVTPLVAAMVPESTYALADEDELRALPRPEGGARSIYGPDALVAGTQRGERLFFWPMGIASPGTMRQWGRHPTAFLDRRHFDDADLLDLRFEFARGQAQP